jgi:hypothetical protein
MYSKAIKSSRGLGHGRQYKIKKSDPNKALPTLPDQAQAKPTQSKTSLSNERQFISRKGKTIPSCGLPA